ncbi:peptidoglycan-associated lipoprotein Pal [Arhodomonas sp. AD133]|uniref:peptidoglycan-associated lipoprotein Pal n=1 Tax=Arhodomonas sp. AD133 TaxID=3415009 RepID=UPI003EBCF526
MQPAFRWIAIALLALAVTGCATTDKTEGDAATMDDTNGEAVTGTGADDGTMTGEEMDGAEASGAGAEGGFTSADLEDPASPLSTRVFYFPFDSSQLSDGDTETLTAHAEYLATHPEVSVIVEGHTDERGAREYNLALGERRAQSVSDILTLNGAAGDQVTIVSYGEEKPAVNGHDEQAWSKNRRAELVYER